MRRLIRIDLSKFEINSSAISDEELWFGGRGLTSHLVASEVDPAADPLGEANKLVFAPGVFGGTAVPCSGRLSIGAKSPLTGGIKESNVGGTAATRLAWLGIGALVLEGQPKDKVWSYLYIDAQGVRLFPAGELRGLGNYATAEKLRVKYPGSAVISIGPAGELQLPVASIAVTSLDGYPSRHAGRGGLGAVMGAKGIKAIVINDHGTGPRPAAQKNALQQTAREFARELKQKKSVLTRYGTANLVSLVNEAGGLPTRNFSRGRFDLAPAISGEKLAETIRERGGKAGHPCHSGCAIRCSNIYLDQTGNYLTSGLEYETIALLGANCGVGDLDAIAVMDRLCDDYGLDTMEMGDALAVAMEGGVLEFGDAAGMVRLLHETGTGKTLAGRMLGRGTVFTGRLLGVKRIPAVKGQGLSAYDPRVFKGTGVTYATSPMGADHTAGNGLPGRTGYHLRTRAGVSLHDTKNQVELSRDLQIMTAVCDFTGLCFFVGYNLETMEFIAKLYEAQFGAPVQVFDLLDWGREIIKKERQFNRRAGFTAADDALPAFFTQEKLAPNDSVFDLPPQEVAGAMENL